MFIASGFCGAGRERGCFAAESLGPWGLLARRYQGNLGTKESMADGPNCKAHVWTVSKDKFVELCPRNVPFMEAVVLRGSEKLNLAEDEGKNFVLACKTTRLARDKSTLPNSQRDLLLNACINSTDFADFKESFGGSRDWSPDSDVLILAVSEDFSRQYLSSAGALGADHLWVKKSRAIPLQKVLVGITAEKSYAWAERNLVDVLSRCSENNPILVRGKSPFPLRVNENENQELPSLCEDLFVLLCEPVQQGLITSNTSIILSRMEIEPSGKINRLPTEEGREHTVNQSDLLTSFLISEFTNPVKEFSSLDSPTNLNHFKLEVEITLQPSVEISTFKGVNTVIADHCSRLYVTMATLMSIGLFNGTWVKVWRQKTDKTKEHTQIQTCYSCSTMDPLLSESCPSRNMEKKFEEVRSGEGMSESVTKKCCDTESSLDQRSDSEKPAFHIVQLFAIDEGLFERRLNLDSAKSMKSTDSEIKHQSLLSPSLFFNLFGSFCNMEPRPLCMDPVESGVKSSWVQAPIQHQDSRPNPAHPPFATDAHVALVLSPVSKTLDVFDEALTRHFTHSRLLTVGDVFGVEWDWRDVSSSATEAQKQRNCHIYFKVTKLVCGRQDVVSSFVDVKHTSLYQRGVVHSYAPPTIKAFDQPPLLKTVGIGHNTFVDLLRPRGLEGYVQNLCDVVKPYLSQSCTLPPTGILLTGPPGVGKRTVAEATARSLCLHSFGINCYDLIGESVAATETRIRNAFQKGLASSPCIMLMRNIHALGKDREGNEDEPRIAQTVTDCISKLQAESYRTVVVIAASSRPQDIPTDLLPCFLHEICMEAPSEDDRRSMLAGLMEVRSVADDISLRQLAKRTAGMVASDLTALLSQASCVSTKRVLDSCAKMDVYPKGASATFKGSNDYQFPWQLEQDICRAGVCILWEDLEQALDILQAAQSDAIGAPKIPSVKWEDVGGLANVKAEILDTVQLPLQHPELFAAGLRRSGVLLYGPPGTGKTLLAKAVATECSLNFLSVKGPELINMYVGQSEQNVREVFSRAQSARPCVIFFDELDSLAPNRGRSGDSGGVMDRVVSQLLAELDGLHKACDVFVIGATNRPDLLDPALLRPGRFDKMMYLGISEDHDAQLQILRALTRKFHLDAHFHLDEFVTQCPANLTGADFYALCSDAMLHSVKRKIHSLDAGEDIGEDEVEVKEEDFKAALDKLVPSVSSQELKRYQQLQQEFGVAGSTLNKKQ